jgi:peptidase M56, blaR1
MVFMVGVLSGCNYLTTEKQNSFVVYAKNDGIYYTYLNGEEKKEQKIQDGEEFECPKISEDGEFVAYQKENELYLYTLSTSQYQKLADMEQYQNYEWLGQKLVYADESAGFYLYDTQSNQSVKYDDDNHYENFKASKDGKLYAKQLKNWETSEGKFSHADAIVEIDCNALQSDEVQTNILIEAKAPENNSIDLGYDPTISKISEDGRYLLIHEKFQSGSTSADYAGFGIYDTKQQKHIDFTDIYNQREEENELIVLPYEDNIALSSKENSSIALIKGGGREMFFNKELALMRLQEDGTYDLQTITPDNILAMTPSFTTDGQKLIYSGIAIESTESYEETQKDWDTKPHDIYQYDNITKKTGKITDGIGFDYMPISLSEEDILFFRSKKHQFSEHTGNLIRLKDGEEDVVASEVCLGYQPNRNMAVFIGRDLKR